MYKKWVRVFLIFLLITSNFSIVTSAQESIDETADNSSDSSAINSPDWKLSWSDEFEGDTLDESKWTYDTGNGFVGADGTYTPGWGNEELQNYQEDNVSVEDGKLVLEAREETSSDEHGEYDYTSGKITTRGKFSQKYGRFEAKMALPEGQGYWPAFWMMPEDDVYGGWAASGEIDIMENSGSNLSHIGGAIHYGGQWPNNTYTAKDYHFPDGQDITDFNVYAVEWEPGEIRWYVNGDLYQTLNNWNTTSKGNPAKFAYPAPFDQEFFMILNLAIGGWYGGGPDETTPIPGDVKVDYVRAYELTDSDYQQPAEPVFEPEELPTDAKEAIDGNYLYDTAYDNGFTTIATGDDEWDYDYWNLVYMPDFNGNASASVEDINGDSFAKVDITEGGNQPYSVQLIQNVTVGKGRWYKLSFDAKSTTDRNLNVKIGGGPDRGYVAYSPNTDFNLTDEIQSYELIFQMQQDSDPLARLELNMGLNTNPVWIGNAKLEETVAVDPYDEYAPKEPLSNGNHVYNGTFDQGNIDRMTYWDLLTESADASASVDPEARELAVAITDGGSTSDAIELVQTGMNLLPNDEYKVTFDARAAEGRDIEVAVLSKEGDVNYSDNQTVSLSTTMEAKEMTFVMPDVEDLEGQLVFLLGGNTSDVVIDNVQMIRTTNNNAGVTLEEAFPLKNGDFSNGLDSWTEHYQGQYDGTSKATFAEEDSRAKITVENNGANPWDISLSQEGLKLFEGLTYVIEFDVSASMDRKVELVIDNGAAGGYFRYLEDIVDVTTDVQTITYEFEMPTTDTIGLKFLAGKVDGVSIEDAHDIFIDNVKLEVKDEREKYFPLTNGDFSAGIENWENYVHDDVNASDAGASIVEEDGKAKIAVDYTGTESWGVQFYQSDLTLEEGLTYIVEFDASASMDRGLEFSIENAAYNRYQEGIVQLTEELQTFSYEFEMPNTDTVAFKFLLGAVDGVGIEDAHDIFIDNVRLEVKGAQEVLSGSQGEQQPEEPSEPEEPTDPSDKEWNEVGENLVVDGSFDTTTEVASVDNPALWNAFNQGNHEDWAGLADFSVIDGVVNAQINQVGWAWWQIQLLQDVTVPSGTYKVAFDMQSDHDRLVSLELVDSGVAIQQFNVNNTMETYEAIIEVNDAGDYSLMLGLGRDEAAEELAVPYTMLIDNVRLVEVEEVVPVAVEENTDVPVAKNNRINLSNSKASIKMPTNLPENTTVAIDLVEDIVNTPEGHNKAGEVIDVNLSVDEGFEGDFELTLGYEDGFEDVAIYYFNETTNEWEKIGGVIDPETNTITATVTHFSTYGVLGTTSEEPVDQDGDESGDQDGNESGDQDGNESGDQDGNESGDQDGNESGDQDSNESGDQDGNESGDQDGDESATEDSETDEDSELPDTATSMFNLLLVGLLLAITGLALFFYQRRKKETTV
ncbi:hypothetical protein GCM10011351_13500 [Paraliobacillus quinghaiensis]|uniref:GH16 domain-containing protein n=1 Tax=Paraliobacillus quinghaiensis TaxID=470815 RepID=A0A917WSU8_9BACI|nr:carbohydrate binding domain-containing protein [Paraliobacillus quinghaiensis]GGM28801.1 hypothetical protein GCM10011351_13500 [Paraliobacillus quinghaiensis]